MISSTRIHNGVEAYLNLHYNSHVSAILNKMFTTTETYEDVTDMRSSPHFGILVNPLPIRVVGLFQKHKFVPTKMFDLPAALHYYLRYSTKPLEQVELLCPT